MADKLKILIVDDSRIALAQLRNILDQVEECEVVGAAKEGVSAIRAVAHHKPDLVLMDIVMPEMDGLSALRILHSNHPGLRVVMVSSLGGSGNHAEEAFRLGAIQVIGKPFEQTQIEALVESEIQQRSGE